MTDPLDQHAAYCITACNDCATDCGACFAGMVGQNSPNSCPACCIECAALCRITADAIARQSPFAKRLAALCAEACDWCAKECGEHAMDHCKRCAASCARCADACRAMAA